MIQHIILEVFNCDLCGTEDQDEVNQPAIGKQAAVSDVATVRGQVFRRKDLFV